MLKEDAAQEVEPHKEQLEHNRIKHRILEERVQRDGSVIIKVIKQYDTGPIGEYLG